jgi:LCP family protein required for cell wall assembly
MKKNTIIILSSMVLLTVIVGILVVQGWHKPLGTTIDMPTRTPVQKTETPTAVSNPQIASTDENPFDDTVEPTNSPQPVEPQPVCGGPPVMYLLGIGADNDYADYLYGLADVIRVARVDFVNTKVTVLTIPRDLWVEFPDIIDKYADKVTHGKLNQAYLYGGPGMGYYDGPGGGPGLLARTLAHNYGLYVDHYGAVNMTAFVKIVDALGGIDLYLEQDWDGTPIDDITEDMGYFTAGQHHMSGEEALRFSRIRKRYSTMARENNQTLVLCAIKDKVLSPSVIGSIPQLINSLIGEIQTDLTPAQISQLTCLLPKLGKDDLQFVSFPDEFMVSGREFDPNLGNTTFVWNIPKEDIQAFMRDFENDAIESSGGSGMSCP